MNNSPIGIVDSGVGGLTVWREIIRELPHESTVYLADSAHTPYGAKSSEEIYQLSRRLIRFSLDRQVKLIIIACNTITVSCLDTLREEFPDIPLIGTVPVVKAATTKTRNKQIGILSTTRTAKSNYQKQLIKKYAAGYEVINVGTDQLVPLIEEGITQGEAIERVLKRVLQPIIRGQCDAVALGCTHYPFIQKEIQTIVGSNVQLLEPSSAIARHAKRILTNNNALAAINHTPEYQYYTTGEKEQFVGSMRKLLQMHTVDEYIVEHCSV